GADAPADGTFAATALVTGAGGGADARTGGGTDAFAGCGTGTMRGGGCAKTVAACVAAFTAGAGGPVSPTRAASAGRGGAGENIPSGGAPRGQSCAPTARSPGMRAGSSIATGIAGVVDSAGGGCVAAGGGCIVFVGAGPGALASAIHAASRSRSMANSSR